jgi:shikimate kinase
VNLYLIGMRGVGKSTVGAQVALRLNRSFFDADVEINLASGRTIQEIFAQDGEQAFREIEAEQVRRLSAELDCVVAWGGGAILRADNRHLIRETGKSVWLQASAACLEQRIMADPVSQSQRPRLTKGSAREELEQLLNARMAIYTDCANYILQVENRSVDELADAIVLWWEQADIK